MERPKRKPLRLKDYDYSQCGYYFITICTKENQVALSEIVCVGADSIRPKLSEYGIVVESAINGISTHYPNVKVDNYVIMPDHVHLILHITQINQGNGDGRMISAPTGVTLMRVVGYMKRWVSKQIGSSIWQKSFYDHIIRDEEDYTIKYNYIENNPLKTIEKV